MYETIMAETTRGPIECLPPEAMNTQEALADAAELIRDTQEEAPLYGRPRHGILLSSLGAWRLLPWILGSHDENEISCSGGLWRMHPQHPYGFIPKKSRSMSTMQRLRNQQRGQWKVVQAWGFVGFCGGFRVPQIGRGAAERDDDRNGLWLKTPKGLNSNLLIASFQGEHLYNSRAFTGFCMVCRLCLFLQRFVARCR